MELELTGSSLWQAGQTSYLLDDNFLELEKTSQQCISIFFTVFAPQPYISSYWFSKSYLPEHVNLVCFGKKKKKK